MAREHRLAFLNQRRPGGALAHLRCVRHAAVVASHAHRLVHLLARLVALQKGGCANAAWENTSAKTPKDKRLRKDIRHITPQQNRKEQEPNAHRRHHAPKPHARLRHHGVTLAC